MYVPDKEKRNDKDLCSQTEINYARRGCSGSHFMIRLRVGERELLVLRFSRYVEHGAMQ